MCKIWNSALVDIQWCTTTKTTTKDVRASQQHNIWHKIKSLFHTVPKYSKNSNVLELHSPQIGVVT